MRAMFYRALRTIEQAFSARREYMTKDGEILYGGPDHYARLAATKHFRDFLAAGRPAPKQEAKRQEGLTLHQLKALIEGQWCMPDHGDVMGRTCSGDHAVVNPNRRPTNATCPTVSPFA